MNRPSVLIKIMLNQAEYVVKVMPPVIDDKLSMAKKAKALESMR